MGRKSKKKKKKKSPSGAPSSTRAIASKPGRAEKRLVPNPENLEPENAVAGTIAWLLSAFATVLALAASLLAKISYGFSNESVTFNAIHLFLYVATITGVVTLILTPFVLRARIAPPPRNVTRGVVIIGLTPIVTRIAMAVMSMMNR